MISISNLVAGYQEAAVLDDVSLTLGKGQVLTVLGGNGAGKTTLLRVISGLLRPRGGDIRFNDRCITGCSPTEVVALGIAHVPEGRRIFPGLSVKQNLRIGAYTIRDKRRVRENLERVYDLFPILKERHGQVATTLSGGEQQMLAIGRALMSEPKVLMLDEPTMGLAPIVVERLHGTLERLVETGITILLVEQNAAFAMQLADSVAVLQMGRIVNAGRKDEMQDVHALVSAYLGV